MLVSIILSSVFSGHVWRFLERSKRKPLYILLHYAKPYIHRQPSPILIPPLHPHQPPQSHPPSLPTIQLGPHIQIKRQPPTFSPIKINHILHPSLPLTPLHHPIMPIKRPLVPQQPQPPRLRTQFRTVPAETPQLRPAAAGVLRRGEAPLPGFDLGPGALVDSVVDRNDSGHVGGVRGVVLPPHGFEEHLFRGVDPVR